MVRSMFAGVAGLRTHQAKMDVIGNNIANVNTWGFKAGSMSFKDTMYQNTSSGSKGSTASGSYGGSNANQVGYGVTTGSITYDFSMGSMAPSARGLDAFIDGTGFYIVGPMVGDGSGISLEDPDVISSNGLFLSRVGKFDVDNQGFLVDDAGNYVYGFSNISDNLSTGTDFNTTSLVPLRVPMEADMAKIGNESAGSKVEAARKALEDARANLSKLNLELSKAREEEMVASTAYETAASTQDIKGKTAIIYTKETGTKDLMEKAYVNWQAEKGDPTKEPGLRALYNTAKANYEEDVNDLIMAQANLRAPKALTDNAANIPGVWTAYVTARDTYNTTQNTANKDALDAARTALDTLYAALSKIEPESLEGVRDTKKQGADKAKAFADAAQNTVYDAEKRLKTAQDSSTSTEVNNAQNSSDNELAELTNYTIQKDGTLTGTTKDGATVIIGKIALAGVQNTSGLEKTTGYYYTPGPNAGNVGIYEAGGAQGQILGNYLEMAKVDLATEMTDMITTQRGFQANSKIITVTDQMLEELVNIKR
ncbi:MAG: flagellar hook-basal body complex protein [Lacrimispora sp.]|uniref:flagellar hook-basal body complex protein n=1 Tax=Lacrimispora sp. TaxID=2719234 RepID=UPI0039E5AB31